MDFGGLGVAGYIGDGFLNNPKNDDLHFWRQPFFQAACLELHLDASRFQVFFGLAAQGQR